MGMKSITWYIGRQVFAVVLLAAFVLCFMVWLFRSLDAVDMMINRGLPVIIPEDATAATEPDVHEMMFRHVLPALATISTTDDVIAAIARR